MLKAFLEIILFFYVYLISSCLFYLFYLLHQSWRYLYYHRLILYLLKQCLRTNFNQVFYQSYIVSGMIIFYKLPFYIIIFSYTLFRSKPLQIWDKQVRNGHIKRITDQDINSSVLEICGTNVSTCFITCPANPNKTLGIKLPFLVMIIKNV